MNPGRQYRRRVRLALQKVVQAAEPAAKPAEERPAVPFQRRIRSLAFLPQLSGSIETRTTQFRSSPYLRSFPKVMLDRVGGCILLLFFSLVLIAFGIVIVCTSRGPALFIQRRYGRNGTVFSIFKLRSMRAADSAQFRQASKVTLGSRRSAT